jgi:hypothetical protein
MPALVPVDLALARTGQVAVSVTGLWAYPTGFEFLVNGRIRPGGPPWDLPGIPLARTLPDDFLRFGVQFATGEKATNLSGLPDSGLDPGPQGPGLSLMASGGGRGGREWRYWVWPLPPAGTLTFACAWPAFDIEEAQAHLDAQLILAGVARSIRLWPEPAP